MRQMFERLYDPEDWDLLEEQIVDCPQCNHKIKVYWSEERDDFLLLGLYCRHCDTPYTDLFTRMDLH